MKIKYFSVQAEPRKGLPDKFTWIEEEASAVDVHPEARAFLFALSRNQEFEKDIIQWRAEAGIPESGFNFNSGDRSGCNWSTIVAASRSLDAKYSFLQYLSSRHILLYNGVLLPVQPIELEADYDHQTGLMDGTEKGEVRIIIRSQITKHALVTFIEKNWEVIEKKLAIASRLDRSTVTDRDMQIVTLREDSDLTFNQIRKQLADSGEVSSAMTEDAIKQAYYRTKEKITQINQA